MTPVLDAPPVTDTTDTPQVIPLNASDRCDATAVVLEKTGLTGRGACGAQAIVRAVFPSGHDLLFCTHHYDDNAVTLAQKGAFIQDEREELVNLKPTDPSRSKV